jgi:hypothetical protein
LATIQVGHAHIFPTYTYRKARSKSFGACFFRSPSFRVGTNHIFASLSFNLLSLSENPIFKPCPKPINRALNTVNISEICANS